MVGEGATLDPGDPAAWAEALSELWADPQLRQRRGDAALDRARERFAADGYYQRLMASYRAALQ